MYLVPTPIGNLGDLTERARIVLEVADLVACEDTRHSGQLLKHLGLKKKLVSYHEHNETTRAQTIVQAVTGGQSVAVITDAGSPGISDPAYRVVRAAIEAGLPIVPLPGPTALIPALTASGLPTDRFFYEGFLPNKSGARQTRLRQLASWEHTLIFYESPHRLAKSLSDMSDVLGDRQCCVAREISKLHEQFIRGTLQSVLECIGKGKIRGEIVIVVAGESKKSKSR